MDITTRRTPPFKVFHEITGGKLIQLHSKYDVSGECRRPASTVNSDEVCETTASGAYTTGWGVLEDARDSTRNWHLHE